MGNNRIFLSAGHSNADPGAIGNGYKEADLTKELRGLVACEIVKDTSIILSLDQDLWTSGETARRIGLLSKEGDVLCDIHFNAATPQATGTEVLIPDEHSTMEKKIAAELSSGIASVLNIKNRGVKTEGQSARGKLVFMRPKGRNILIEVCFITNATDMQSYQSKKSAVAKFIAETLIKYAKVAV